MSESPSSVRVFGVVPAAGHSRRMGQPKQLMPVAGRPMLLVVIDGLLGGGVEGLAVVTQSTLAESLDLARREDLVVAVNDDADSAMIDSVLLGLEKVESAYGARPDDGVLVLPGDCAGVGAAAVQACAEAYRAAPGRLIVASHRGRRGHPLVFPFELAGKLRELARTGGLNQLLETQPDRVVMTDCADHGVLGDLDTPSDYRRFREPPDRSRLEEPG